MQLFVTAINGIPFRFVRKIIFHPKYWIMIISNVTNDALNYYNADRRGWTEVTKSQMVTMF